MTETIRMTVNGIPRSLVCEGKESPLEILRERLDLTGAKEGCGYGVSGSCTVVVNGDAVTACTYRGAEKLDGIDVLTIEGLAGEDGSLHPIQEAFIEAGAVQCGFCTPGFILRLYALFSKNPDASVTLARQKSSPSVAYTTTFSTPDPLAESVTVPLTVPRGATSRSSVVVPAAIETSSRRVIQSSAATVTW